MSEQRQWHAIGASVLGQSHLSTGVECQDFCQWEEIMSGNGKSTFVSVVSDGAGSAKFSSIGAKVTCGIAADLIATFIENGGDVGSLRRPFFEGVVERIQGFVHSLSQCLKADVSEFACTMMIAVIDDSHRAFAQLGDGAIVVRDADAEDYSWIFWPMSGEYENITYFVTQPDAKERLAFETGFRPVNEVALFSDGLQRLALHFETQTAFAPFFANTLGSLKGSTEEGLSQLEQSLRIFLDSDRINARTDDDKTLVLARRITSDVYVQ